MVSRTSYDPSAEVTMEESVKETCLKELGYQILDQDEKVCLHSAIFS